MKGSPGLFWSGWSRTLRRRLLGTIVGAHTREPVAALTFDDGPHPTFTPRLLALLDRHGARATFFMVGESAARQPELVRQVARAGHTVANHTWDHPSFTRISSAERRSQVQRCAQALAPYGTRLFRPPYGHQDPASRRDLFWLGYQVVTWNILGRDWDQDDAQAIAGRVAEGLRPGSIVLLHDALYTAADPQTADREGALEAVARLLEQFQALFRFVTVPELLETGPPMRREWNRAGDTGWLNSLVGVEGDTWHYDDEAKGYKEYGQQANGGRNAH